MNCTHQIGKIAKLYIVKRNVSINFDTKEGTAYILSIAEASNPNIPITQLVINPLMEACKMPEAKLTTACVPEFKGFTYKELVERMKSKEFKPFIPLVRHEGLLSIDMDNHLMDSMAYSTSMLAHIYNVPPKYIIHEGGQGSGKSAFIKQFEKELEKYNAPSWLTLDAEQFKRQYMNEPIGYADGTQKFIRKSQFEKRNKYPGRELIEETRRNKGLYPWQILDHNPISSDWTKLLQGECGKTHNKVYVDESQDYRLKYDTFDQNHFISEGFFTWQLGKERFTTEEKTFINNYINKHSNKMKTGKKVPLSEVELTEEEKKTVCEELKRDNFAKERASQITSSYFYGMEHKEKKRLVKMLILQVDAEYELEKKSVADQIAKLEEVLVEKNSKSSLESDFLK